MWRDLGRLPRQRIPEAGSLAAFEHPQDRVGIEIGIELWRECGVRFTPEILEEAIVGNHPPE
jgi:hypothetical protein